MARCLWLCFTVVLVSYSCVTETRNGDNNNDYVESNRLLRQRELEDWEDMKQRITALESTQEAETFTLQSEISTLQSMHASQKSEISTLQSMHASQKSEISTLQSMHASQKSEISTLQSMHASQKSEISTLQSMHASQKSEISTLQSMHASQKSEISTLQSMHASQKSEISTLQSMHASQKSEISTLQSMQASQKSEISTLQSMYASQKSEISTPQSILTTQESKSALQEAEISRISTKLVKAQECCKRGIDEAVEERKIRILLSDPSYLQQELHQIQVKLQEYEVVKTDLMALQHQVNYGEKGSVYVRWGRKDCPGDNITELVYSGYAGGSHYTHSGAAAEYVCLPPDPTWGPHKNIRSFGPALMYGAEYEDPMLFGVPDDKQDVPCAVCRSPAHSTSIMIPARTQCYSDWYEAYHGILSAGHHSHTAASQYVCVDEHPQTLTGGGSTDGDGKLFYQVRTRCGSLTCPPYEDDKVLSCVVCLK